MKLLLVLLSTYIFSTNTICVEVIDSPDTYIQGKVFEIPLDSNYVQFSPTMWYDVTNDSLYYYNHPCLQCFLVQVNPATCE